MLQMPETCIMDLPHDVLSKIFSLLSLTDRARLEAVCKTFQILSLVKVSEIFFEIAKQRDFGGLPQWLWKLTTNGSTSLQRLHISCDPPNLNDLKGTRLIELCHWFYDPDMILAFWHWYDTCIPFGYWNLVPSIGWSSCMYSKSSVEGRNWSRSKSAIWNKIVLLHPSQKDLWRVWDQSWSFWLCLASHEDEGQFAV